MSDKDIEQQIKAKGLTAPRVTPEHIQSVISHELYFTAQQGVYGEAVFHVTDLKDTPAYPVHKSLGLLTFCVMVLKNGFTVTGESACASPENFDPEIGRKIARDNAVNKIWMLEGYLLKQKLSETPAVLQSDLPPHQLRVLEELTQLSEKLKKLNNFINGDSRIFNGLDPEEQKRLRDQSNFMTEYQTVLAQRVAAF